ncbi:MAG: phosphoribosylglycinamide formyltransferase [Gammaproteobacteria bacterium]
MKQSVCRVVVLGSGHGSNFEALAEATDSTWQIVAAGSDKRDAPLLAKAERRGIPTFYCEPAGYPDRAAHDVALAAAVAQQAPDLVLLAGYIRLLGPAMLEPWSGRLLNVHPSLLPAWPGLHTHERVLNAGDTMHGATVHFVIPELDSGPRIIQGRLAVQPNEDVATLTARVHRLEHCIYPRAVGWYANGRLKQEQDMAVLDGNPLTQPVIIEEAECV